MADIGHVALGAWSGGRFMHFGEEIDEDRFVALLRPGDDIHTLITADVYGSGACDALVGRAIEGLPRDDFALIGAIGHDFYDGERQGAKGFPRFTNPALRGPDGYADYLRAAAERSLERCGTDHFDLLMLHNPDRIGYSSEVVWHAMAGLREQGMARADRRGPRTRQRLHARPDRLPRALRRHDRLGDDHPQPLRALARPPGAPGPRRAATCARSRGSSTTAASSTATCPTRAQLGAHDHRAFRPEGWVQAGRDRLEKLRPIAEAHGLSSLQLACQWTLAHPSVECVVPTLVQEPGAARASGGGEAGRPGRRARARSS